LIGQGVDEVEDGGELVVSQLGAFSLSEVYANGEEYDYRFYSFKNALFATS
jgi:hypothetical protein